MVVQGYTVTLVAATLAISRSSLYYRKRLRGSRADRTYDEQIVVAYGYRRVAWWLRRKENLPVNRKRVLRVMRERGLLVRSRRLRARRKKEWGRVEAAEPNQIWQSDMTKIWAGPAVGWAYLVCVIDAARGRSWDGISPIAVGPKTRSWQWSRPCSHDCPRAAARKT